MNVDTFLELRELRAIVTELANQNDPNTWGISCPFCPGNQHGIGHSDNCLWIRAREYG